MAQIPVMPRDFHFATVSAWLQSQAVEARRSGQPDGAGGDGSQDDARGGDGA